MNKVKWTLISYMLCTAWTIWCSDLDQLTMDYNHKGLQELLINSETNDSALMKDIAYRHFWVLEQTNASQNLVEESALRAIDLIETDISSADKSADDYYRLAHMYNSMIIDASSWMKYNSAKDKNIRLCLIHDPNHKDGLVFQARNLLMFPPNAGGNAEQGMKMLNELNEKYPDDISILLLYADYALVIEKFETAKRRYGEILNIEPMHFKAKYNYEKLVLLEKELTIGNINVSSEMKTKMGDKLTSIREFEGETYNRESIYGIEGIAYSLPSITGMEIETIEAGNSVDLIINFSEDNTKVYGLMGGFSINNTGDDSPSLGGFPVFLYMDQNFLGSGNVFTLSFSGIYLGLDMAIRERPVFPLNMSFHIDGLFLPLEQNVIEDGLSTDWQHKTPVFNTSVSLVKETSIGFIVSMNHNLKINYFTGGVRGFTTSENNFTYSGNVKLEFTTMESGIPSQFVSPEGFSLSFCPTLVFKPSYVAWGVIDNLFEHDDNPGAMFASGVRYYKSFSRRINLGGSFFHYGSLNNYESERWAVGQTNMISEGPRLSGYLEGEFRTDNALLLNINSRFHVIPDTFTLFAKHDVMYEMDDDFFRQGSAVGFALNFPHQIEFSAEAAIGWNARRDYGRGWSVQLGLSKFFIR